MSMSEMLKERKKLIEESIADWNEALKKNDAAAMEAIEKGVLKDREKEYAKQAAREMYKTCGEGADPILEAVRRRVYIIQRHKKVSVDGRVVRMEIEPADKVINLVELCEYLDKPTLWHYKVSKFFQLLLLAKGSALGKSKTELDEIGRTYKMKDKAREVDLGGIPVDPKTGEVSNKKMTQAFQKVVDAIIFEAGAKGNNRYAVTNHDIRFLEEATTKLGRNEGTIVYLSGTQNTILMDVLRRIVLGKKYDIEYKKAKKAEDKPEQAKTEAPQAEAPKAEPKQAEPAAESTPVEVVEREPVKA